MIEYYLYLQICLTILGILSWICLRTLDRSSLSPIRVNQTLKKLSLLIFFIPLIRLFNQDVEIKIVSSGAFHTANEISSINNIARINEVSNSEFELGILFFAFIAFFIGRYILDLFKVKKILNKSILFKKFKNIQIVVNPYIKMPFAFWLPGKKYIIIPEYVLLNTKDKYLVISHEAQHHKHKDTIWSHLNSLLKSVCFINPFYYIFQSSINEIQELACDEALIGHKDTSLYEYSRCLLEVAQHNLNYSNTLFGTIGVGMSSSGNKLKRRFKIMKRYQYKESTISKTIAAIVTMTVITSAAYASKELISSKKVNKIEIEELVKKVNQETDFPIELNERVLEQLNTYIGTENGRSFIKSALKRKQNYELIFSKKLKRYNAPDELLAVALMESGYKNIPQQSNSKFKAAGVWQFIPETARSFGLKVNVSEDERLDVTKETDAALRLLTSLKLRFKDWRLALMAYNAGSGRVQKGIDEVGGRNPWDLVDQGYEGDTNYLAKVMAGVIILKNKNTLLKN